MLKEAKAKIEKEVEENKDNNYISYIGERLIDYITKNPQHAKHFLDEDKSVGESLAFMRDKARKKAKSGMAMFTPEEGMQIVFEYYGIEENQKVSTIETSKRIDISLDDLL